jgi:hypothetical protein
MTARENAIAKQAYHSPGLLDPEKRNNRRYAVTQVYPGANQEYLGGCLLKNKTSGACFYSPRKY